MTIQNETAEAAVDFPGAAEAALQDTARRSGLDAGGARLIRLFATAVYHLPAADAVARIALVTSPESVERLDISVQVTRWLTGIGFPCVEPLAVQQPVTSHGCAVTFWRYLPQDGPEPVPADLGRLLRELHELGPPPVALPVHRPLVSVRRAIASSRALDEGERAWLGERCDQLVAAYGQLRFQLPAGMIHGDAYRGNLLRDGQRVVRADWDAVSTGPREVDLIPTLQATRFGLPDDQRDAFVAAYGQDIRSWDGYPVLRDIRELSTLTALLRDGHAAAAAAQRELRVRLRSIRSGDRHEWSAF
jgi:aminoglycoside phosphotransferase (APT) family kinase protein